MAPYEALYGRPCRSPICWTEVGESSITDPDLIRDTLGKGEFNTAASSHYSKSTEKLRRQATSTSRV